MTKKGIILNYEKTAYFRNQEVILKKGMLVKFCRSQNGSISGNRYLYVLDVRRIGKEVHIKFVSSSNTNTLDSIKSTIREFANSPNFFNRTNSIKRFRVGIPSISAFNKDAAEFTLISTEMAERLLQ